MVRREIVVTVWTDEKNEDEVVKLVAENIKRSVGYTDIDNDLNFEHKVTIISKERK